VLALVFALVASIGLRNAVASDLGAPGEYEIKAAFLFNFMKFVKWSDAARPDDSPTIGVCVLAADDVARTIDETIGGKAVRDKRVVVRRLRRAELDPDCHVVFLSGDERVSEAELLRSSTTAGVLTVGEADGFAARGGVIAFRLESGKVRFDINPDAAKRAHLEVSSQLLKLAGIVHDGASP